MKICIKSLLIHILRLSSLLQFHHRSLSFANGDIILVSKLLLFSNLSLILPRAGRRYDRQYRLVALLQLLYSNFYGAKKYCILLFILFSNLFFFFVFKSLFSSFLCCLRWPFLPSVKRCYFLCFAQSACAFIFVRILKHCNCNHNSTINWEMYCFSTCLHFFVFFFSTVI